MSDTQAPAVASDALFGIRFGEGQVRFDFWPDDLAKTVGRMALIPWKTCYASNGVPDMIDCGEIVTAKDGWIKVKSGSGFIETSIEHAFLVPNPTLHRGANSGKDSHEKYQ